ncbi:MAG: DUF6285 domain-containing protein [Actinomycetota bacterium]
MQDRPTAPELLRDIAATLDERIVPLLSGNEQHQVRVAANLCRILEREVRLGPALEAEERTLLFDLLPDQPADTPTARLTAELATQVASSDDPDFLARARAALLRITGHKLAVNKPGYDAFDFAGEVAGS